MTDLSKLQQRQDKMTNDLTASVEMLRVDPRGSETILVAHWLCNINASLLAIAERLDNISRFTEATFNVAHPKRMETP